jgi:hypothetical protein
MTWAQPSAGGAWPLAQAETSDTARPNNPQVIETISKLADANQVSRQTFSYDLYNNPTDTYEYDFGAAGTGAAGPLVRRTHTDYVTAPAYVNADVNPALGAGLRGLPSQQWVSSDAAGSNKAALTAYAYDQYGLTARVGIAGQCPYYGNPAQPRGQCSTTGAGGEQPTGLTTRGNLMSVTRYADASGLSFWTGQAGTTAAARQNVLNSFATSTSAREFSGTLYRETF